MERLRTAKSWLSEPAYNVNRDLVHTALRLMLNRPEDQARFIALHVRYQTLQEEENKLVLEQPNGTEYHHEVKARQLRKAADALQRQQARRPPPANPMPSPLPKPTGPDLFAALAFAVHALERERRDADGLSVSS
jgi:hypothetical protein